LIGYLPAGIKQHARAFDPFFTTKKLGEGAGLGLSVVHGIARAHDAHVRLESSPATGSEFRVLFPAISELALDQAIPAQESVKARVQGKHILYIDDEEGLLFLMRRLLDRQGYRVSAYADPREALAAARANAEQVDLVVTDYSMPHLSGLDVALALRDLRPELPVVLCSGYITEDLRAKAPAAGIRELIYKPNTVDDLRAAITRVAENGASGPKPS
jgi:CheY-like chemotaxis protein